MNQPTSPLSLSVDTAAIAGQTVRLLLDASDAAKALGISTRLLWTMTKRGEVPHVRLGRRVLYPVDLLQAWLRDQAAAVQQS